jgi:hypothetical protein
MIFLKTWRSWTITVMVGVKVMMGNRNWEKTPLTKIRMKAYAVLERHNDT